MNNTTENTATAILVGALTAAALEPKQQGDSTHLLLPPEYSHVDISEAIEKTAATPRRKKGYTNLTDVNSLLVYCLEQAAEKTGYIYADQKDFSITGVFNDARSTTAGWRDHRAIFKAEQTPEFKTWMGMNKKPFGQTEFAEFIEDNFADLQGEDANRLLTVATTIQTSNGINFSSAKRLQDGQTQIMYTEQIDATAGEAGDIKIPKTFALGLRIFQNGEGYKLTARLKFRMNSGAIKFWFELDRPERAIDDAFADYIEKVRAGTKYTVLLGKA